MRLEFFILKFSKPLLRYLLTCQAHSAFLSRFFLDWAAAAAALKGLSEFWNKNLHYISSSLLSQNYKTQDFSPLMERVLAGVYGGRKKSQLEIIVRI